MYRSCTLKGNNQVFQLKRLLINTLVAQRDSAKFSAGPRSDSLDAERK